MKHQRFAWKASTAVSLRCDWNDYSLEAWTDGRWRVALAALPHKPLADHTTQSKGTNIIEARDRAQAAAMNIHKAR